MKSSINSFKATPLHFSQSYVNSTIQLSKTYLFREIYMEIILLTHSYSEAATRGVL